MELNNSFHDPSYIKNTIPGVNRQGKGERMKSFFKSNTPSRGDLSSPLQ
jgi:hypothetical protein